MWLRAFDVKMGTTNKEGALFTDHCLAHPLVEIQNTKVIFLPADTVSVLQQVDIRLPIRTSIFVNFMNCHNAEVAL
jgi:hypothetical protein